MKKMKIFIILLFSVFIMNSCGDPEESGGYIEIHNNTGSTLKIFISDEPNPTIVSNIYDIADIPNGYIYTVHLKNSGTYYIAITGRSKTIGVKVKGGETSIVNL